MTLEIKEITLTEQQLKLPKFSYSKLSTFDKCPMNYKFKYIEGNYVGGDAVHLDLGTISHKVMEIKARNIIDGETINYDFLTKVFYEGIVEATDKDKEQFLIGVNEIRKKYGEDTFTELNKKSELTYDDKIKTFLNYVPTNQFEDDWKPFATELHFEIVYKDKVRLHGFIDRIDINSKGEIRVVDYKSSNMPFEHKDLTTPLQMFIYCLACEALLGKTPVQYIYDMIFLGVIQEACTKGYYKRGEKKLNKLIDKILEAEEYGIYAPNPIPLCYWCDFSKTNPNAPDETKFLCEYYSLWRPDKKSFNVNKKYEPEEIIRLEDLEF